MKMRKSFCLGLLCAPLFVLNAQAPAGRFDGNWTTTMACEQHGQMPAYKWDFPGVIKGSVFHAQHSEQGAPGYLVIDGPIKDDGTAKLQAKGTVQESKASGVFALKGNNYDYVIHAQFAADKGTGTRDKGVGILGRTCTFDFTRQADAPAPAPPAQ